MKYLLFSNIDYPDAYNAMPISGLFHWMHIFGGQLGAPSPDILNDYDIIHVNLTTNGLMCMNKIRKMISWKAKPKLICNIDYALQMWSGQFNDVEIMLDACNMADFIFHVEEEAADALTSALGRKVYFIPHPIRTDALKKMAVPGRDMSIFSFIHRYDNQWMAPWIVSKDLGMETVACIMNANPTPSVMDGVMKCYDQALPYTPFEKFIPILSRAYAGVESYVLSSYGRTTGECAALGVPCVGANIVGTIKQCFPMLATAPMDYTEQRKLLSKLIQDQGFWQECVEMGRKNVEFYGYEQSKWRMLEAMQKEGVYSPKMEDGETPADEQLITIQEGGIVL